MDMEYRVFTLSHGQMAPEGSTGVSVDGGGIMWVGEVDTFPTEALFGTKLPTDPVFQTTYNHRSATDDEIYDYENPPEIDDEEI